MAEQHEKVILMAFNGTISERTASDKHDSLMDVLEMQFSQRDNKIGRNSIY